jgi:hypothetical protein
MRSILSAMAVAALSIHAASAAEVGSHQRSAAQFQTVPSIRHAAPGASTQVNDAIAGVLLYNGRTTYDTQKSFYVISASYTVPTVQMTTGVCDSGIQYATEFLMLDQVQLVDPPQGGTVSNIDCEGSKITTQYGAYFGVPGQPVGKVYTDFDVQPGDVVNVWLWVANNTVNFYIVDLNTGDFLQDNAPIPSGQQYVGNSATWGIVAPTVSAGGGSSVEPLANYTQAYMTSAYVADNETSPTSWGAGAGTLNTTLWQDGGLQTVSIVGPATLIFDTGCAERSLSCGE